MSTLLFLDPFLLFRALVTIVLGGIWLYTMIEGIGLLVTFLSRTKQADAARLDAKKLISEVESISGRIPATLVRRLKESRRRLGDARAVRTGKKLALLKIMQFFSLSTLNFVWRELAVIGVLLVLIIFLMSYYYSIVI